MQISYNKSQASVTDVREYSLFYPPLLPPLQARSAAPIGLTAASLTAVVFSSGEDHVEPAFYPWAHKGALTTFDASA